MPIDPDDGHIPVWIAIRATPNVPFRVVWDDTAPFFHLYVGDQRFRVRNARVFYNGPRNRDEHWMRVTPEDFVALQLLGLPLEVAPSHPWRLGRFASGRMY